MILFYHGLSLVLIYYKLTNLTELSWLQVLAPTVLAQGVEIALRLYDFYKEYND